MNQSPFFRTNVKIDKIERAGQIDRYGNLSYNTVFTDVDCRLELRSIFTRNPDGDALILDGTISVDKRYRLMVKDRLTVLNTPVNDTYVVFSVDENTDFSGRVTYYSALITKQTKQ